MSFAFIALVAAIAGLVVPKIQKKSFNELVNKKLEESSNSLVGLVDKMINQNQRELISLFNKRIEELNEERKNDKNALEAGILHVQSLTSKEHHVAAESALRAIELCLKSKKYINLRALLTIFETSLRSVTNMPEEWWAHQLTRVESIEPEYERMTQEYGLGDTLDRIRKTLKANFPRKSQP